MTVGRRRAEPPEAPGAAVTEGSEAPVPEPAPDLGDDPTSPHFLLDADAADFLLRAALRDLATKVARHRWVALVRRAGEPEAEIERLH